MGKQGFRATNTEQYVYLENENGSSVAMGLESGTDTFVIATSSTPDVTTNSTPQIKIDPTGDVTFSPRIDGDIRATTLGDGAIIFNPSQDIIIPPFSDGVVQTNTQGILRSDKGIDGQVLIGSSTGAPPNSPAWANITSLDTTVDITNGPNSIDLSVASCGTSRSGADSFLAILSGTYNLPRVSVQTTYQYGKGKALTEIFDVGNNFFPGNGALAATFTAPATAKYMIYFQAVIAYNANVTTVGSNFSLNLKWTGGFTTTSLFMTDFAKQIHTANINFPVNLTMGNTVTFEISYLTSPGSPTMVLQGTDTSGFIQTWMSGYRIV
jgi:hypothetical protein